MINLELSGLPLFWDEGNSCLYFGEGVQEVEPGVRYLKDMKEVLHSGDAEVEEDAWRELYYMYRNIYFSSQVELFAEKGIRYDITVLLPGTVGEEYIKTAGHYHPQKEGAEFTYPEVYEVLHGRAHYLLQKPYNLQNPHDGLQEVIVVDAQPGEKVVVPSGFGHVTINPSAEPLVMSNLVANDFSSVYDPIYIMGGAGYFELASDEGEGAVFVPNHRYSSLPKLKFCRAVEYSSFSLLKDKPQYKAFIEDRDDFSFLTKPEYFENQFQDYINKLTGNLKKI